ncbi:hypothetical protein Tco_1351326, partial [Tanacetum coccineum]
VRSRGRDFDIPVVFSLVIALLRNKDKEIDKLMALISLSFKKIYKPTNNTLRTSSNTSRANQDNTPRINKGIRECQETKRAKNGSFHKEKMLLYSRSYSTMLADNSGPTLMLAPLAKVDQDEHNIIIDSLDMSYDREQDDQDDDDLAKERDLLASLIEKLKCEIDDNKNRNKFLETLNKALIDKLKGEIEDLKTKNKSLESSNNHFKEGNNKLSKTNQLMVKDLKKFQAELDRYHDVNYASKFVKPEFLKNLKERILNRFHNAVIVTLVNE